MHVAVAAEEDPVGPNLPAAQGVPAHVDEEGDAAYFPAPHATHSASPSLAVYFPVHRQWHISAGPHRPQRLLHKMQGHVGAAAGVSKMQERG